jgi:lipopolysaccharide biosynthesis protein
VGTQRHIAFYLPQYHPIPENDEWWGTGFTEWTNVARSRPRYRGHHQPQLPADLGFYDLRLPEVREAQAALARDHGIDAFCYYHYWFGDGRRLLERPFQEVLDSGRPDLPFCLAWANENWTRRWDGHDRQVLMKQDYAGNERSHGRWLAQAFRDPRYVRVDGKPLFLVYRASELPDPVHMTRVWRDEAMAAGVGEIFLCRIEGFPSERADPRPLGFDASVDFAPDWQLYSRSLAKHAGRFARELTPRGRIAGTYRAFDYDDFKERILAKPSPTHLRFPCVTPGWDNSARRRHDSFVLKNPTPEAYLDWVVRASKSAPVTPGGDSLVFVNAWNEWGEGAHLEPDQKWGRSFLEAHRAARIASPADPPTSALPPVDRGALR